MAVDFDRQPGVLTIEVQDVRTDGMLPSKAKTFEALPPDLTLPPKGEDLA